MTCRFLPNPPAPADENVILPPPLGNLECDSTFQSMLEKCAKAQIDAMVAINTNLNGIYACVFNPRFEASIYDEEDQDYHYPVIPDFEGKLLITGLGTRRFAGEDQWTNNEPLLWWNQPHIFDIKENAKIVVNHLDQKVSFRSHHLRRDIAQHIEIIQVHSLVPFN